MHPNEFDKALRDRYESGSLPPDLAQWEQLAQRLDVHESALPPVRKAGRRVPLFWPVLAAAASVLLVGWLFLQESNVSVIAGNKPTANEPVRKPDGATTAPAQPTQPVSTTQQQPQPTQAHSIARVRIPARRQIQAANTPPSQAQLAAALPESTSVVMQAPREPVQQSARSTEPHRENINFAGREPLQGSGFPVMEDDEPAIRERRQLGVDLNGGYGPGSLKRNYALGVTVNRKLGERLRVEAGVAVVSGTYQSYTMAMSNAFRPGVEAVPENSSNRLTYLQASPGITYELKQGIFAGAGVDAQRLLSSSAQATGFEFSGDQLEAQPSWDFGYTVRAGYRVNRHIKAGMQYRNSVIGTAPQSGTSVQPRNYLLFQLGYSIQ
jgi:hypothetical protein